MPLPTAITDLSQTAASNYPAGSDSPSTLDDVQRAHAGFIALLRDGKGLTNPVTLASAATTDIGGQNSPFVSISGTTTITSFGTNYNGPRFIRFTGILTLTYNATSLILPGAASITTAVGDTAIAVPNQALNGWTVYSYQKANGIPAGVAASGAITASGLTQATSRLLGRTTASTGAVEEITAGSTLTLSAGNLDVARPFTAGTAVATTSGTSIDFTGIPSWAKRVTVMFSGVSTNGTSALRVQVGAGSVETTGYLGSSSAINGAGAASCSTFTNGFDFLDVGSAASLRNGSLIFTLIGSNAWSMVGTLSLSDTSRTMNISGAKTTSSALDRVRITTVLGADTFDAGSINILYE